MFSKTFTKVRFIVANSDCRGRKLSHSAVLWKEDRSSRARRLEIGTLHFMDSGSEIPDEKLKQLSSGLVAMNVGEVGKSGKPGHSDVGKLKATKDERRNVDRKTVNDLGKVETGKVGKVEELRDVGKSEGHVGKVETGKVGKVEELRDVGKSEGHVGKVETGKVGKVEERHDIGKTQSEVEKVEAGTERQRDVGKSEGRRDVGKSQKEVGKIESGNTGETGGIPDEGKREDSTDLKGVTDVGKHQATIKGKIEEIVERSKLGEAKESESGLRDKCSTRMSGTPAAGDGAKVSDDGKEARRSVAGKNEKYSAGQSGIATLKCLIVRAEKFPRDAKLIPALTGVTELKLPEGAELRAISEVTDPNLRELFDVDEYLENLQASQFGAFVLYSPLIPSTHTLLSQNFHVFPQGTICIAGAQLQGKGRAGNVWESPKGCLMFSFTIRMTNGRLLPFLQYVVSLAVIEGLEETCKAKGIPAPEVRIKWPNDLYAKGLKIGGVLCTSNYSAKTFNIVVGVGLNVNNRVPTTCLDALIQELDPEAGAVKQEELLAAIMLRFEKLNDAFSADGFAPLQDSYYDRWLHSGQTIVLEEKDVRTSEVLHTPVTIRGLTRTGYLLASDEQGEQYELHPDGNSFDFLKGLVRSKLSS